MKLENLLELYSGDLVIDDPKPYSWFARSRNASTLTFTNTDNKNKILREYGGRTIDRMYTVTYEDGLYVVLEEEVK